MKTLVVFVCIVAMLVCGLVILGENAKAAELPGFFENMVVQYDCSAKVKTHNEIVVFKMTARYIDTVIKVNENASIQLVFNVTSMNGELPKEVSNVFFPFPLESHLTTLEVPLEKPTPFHYWSIFLDEDLLAEYKEKGRFIGEENFDTRFGTIGAYHMRKVGAYSTYDIFYDKATGWVAYLKETYGGGQIPNYSVAYSIEVAETNASFSPPIPSTFPVFCLAILGILATVVAVGVLFLIKRGKRMHAIF